MKNSIKQISIMGCGWLGWPLAKHLYSQGYTIKGSTTSTEKLSIMNTSGVEGHLIVLKENGLTGNMGAFLSGSECLIINIPPGIRKTQGKNHVKEIEHLLPFIEASSVKHLLFISSISVFKDEESFPRIDEMSCPNNNSETALQLIAIEEELNKIRGVDCSVLRLAGLFDDERHPGKSLAGRPQLSNALAPLNLIHKMDVIEGISQLIHLKLWGQQLNLAYPYHPQKITYYQDYCRRHHLPIPQYDLEKISKGKIIDSTKTEQLLRFNMAHRP